MSNLISVIDSIVNNIGQKKRRVLWLDTHFSFLGFSNKFSSDFFFVSAILYASYSLFAGSSSDVLYWLQYWHVFMCSGTIRCYIPKMGNNYNKNTEEFWKLFFFFKWTRCIICFTDFWVEILWGNQSIHSSRRIESGLGLQLLSDKDCWCYHLSPSPE